MTLELQLADNPLKPGERLVIVTYRPANVDNAIFAVIQVEGPALVITGLPPMNLDTDIKLSSLPGETGITGIKLRIPDSVLSKAN